MWMHTTRFLEVDFFQFLGKLKNFPEIITSIINDRRRTS